jgi:long-chain acyl-CoA synthetase
MLLVHDFLEQSAQRTPDKTALVFERRRWTYAQIDARANQLAHALRERGVARGDRVALFLPNGPELAIAIFGVLKADAVFVVINSTTKPDKLARLVENCEAAALVTVARQSRLAAGLLEHTSSLRCGLLAGETAAEAAAAHPDLIALDDAWQEYPDSPPPRRAIDRDLACLIYTSGSTGDSKGVMSAHSNVVFAASSIIRYVGNVADDVVINALPLSFDYGLYQLLMTFKFGGTLVLERSFAYGAHFLNRMEEERVTGLPGVPTMFAILLQMDLTAFDLSSLRYVTNTAAALPVRHIQEIRRAFPWAKLISMYGLTETKRTLYLPPEELDKRPHSVGIAIPGTEVWLEDEEGRRLGPGEVGELVIRGGHVMRGYWRAPDATAERYRPGPIRGETVCYSGDLFRMDDEGYFEFVSRKDDVIKCRGEKVSPKEVESVIYDLPGVVEVAVVGVPDPVLGQAVKALVVTNDHTLTDKHVLLHCREHLEDYMIPKFVEIVESLPKTTSGKIAKTTLC